MLITGTYRLDYYLPLWHCFARAPSISLAMWYHVCQAGQLDSAYYLQPLATTTIVESLQPTSLGA